MCGKTNSCSSDVFEMRGAVHRLMQHPQNADVIVFFAAERRVSPDNQTPQSGQDMHAVGALARVVSEQVQGAVKVFKIAVGQRLV